MSRSQVPPGFDKPAPAAVTADHGLNPGEHSSKLRITLDPEQPADLSVRTILLSLLTTLEANVEGTIDDLDTEFLHDFRVACRRTRSALTQLKSALPLRTITPYTAEFKWLGKLTGPLRDLDVFLQEMPTYRSLLLPRMRADLDPLEVLIVATRTRAHESVVRTLRSTRFTTLTSGWRKTLETTEPSAERRSSWPTRRLANSRIKKAHRRILNRGRELGDNPPAAALHPLRIDAKKLRYLLEFFHNLYPAREINARIKELKQIQDILGGVNDMEVQRNRLAAFARELHTSSTVGTSSILTLGLLADALDERQVGFRLAFHDAFTEFSGKPVRAAFGRLLGDSLGG